eukprot:CAMPEP_0176294698 /NCGR_PEP_ID=MMETSP0121_2-20121125/57276_1 /TAXON_ID=160619 /ORGANISM="Kryptoperidinium foliaceum, Strain CCMP 1326" /LENGTH=155 /DNA_ID=CAMNT_0017635735 /DNA_START=230 /DNA_END=694 /DNA_ORIENTATION=-
MRAIQAAEHPSIRKASKLNGDTACWAAIEAAVGFATHPQVAAGECTNEVSTGTLAFGATPADAPAGHTPAPPSGRCLPQTISRAPCRSEIFGRGRAASRAPRRIQKRRGAADPVPGFQLSAKAPSVAAPGGGRRGPPRGGAAGRGLGEKLQEGVL